jgi:cell wall-active antibiotic response 4TMS protein YvqF
MQPRHRSFFWPAVLILAGIVALLVNLGVFPVERLILLVNLWPLILIVVGLEIIVRRGFQGAAADVAAALVVVLAVAGAAAYLAINPSPTATSKLDVSAPVGQLHQASLEVNVGSASIDVSAGPDLGSLLYRAHIEYPGPKPDVTFDRSTGALRISQNTNFPFAFANGRFILSVQLNEEASWAVSENTGASRDTINLPHVKVSAITVNTGASSEDMTLGPPTGIVPVEINGGALTVHVHRPSGTEVSVRVSGGADSLDVDGHNQHGIGDLAYDSSGFSGASDAYRIRVNGGACTVTLDTSTGSA